MIKIAFLAIIFLVSCLGISNITYSVAESSTNNNTTNYSIKLEAEFNPNEVDTSKDANLDLYLRNMGNASININSIEIAVPKGWRTISQETISNIEVNRSAYINYKFDVPFNASSGKYKIGVTAKTQYEDYLIFPELTVKSFEFIPLTASELPLSIFVILASGLISYLIIIYGLTSKLDTSYITAGIVSFGLGLLNWSISRYIGVSRDPMELYQNVNWSLLTILIGFVTGTSIYGLFWIFKKIRRRWYNYNLAKSRIKEAHEKTELYKKTGIWQEENKTVWDVFIESHYHYIRNNLGIKYAVSAKVYLKKGVCDVSLVEGIIYRWDDLEKEFPIVLYPRYQIESNRIEVIEILGEKSNENNQNPFYDDLKNDKVYRELVSKSFRINDDYENVFDKIITMLRVDLKSDFYIQHLTTIDFSKYTKYVWDKIISKEKTRKQFYEYTGPYYIPGNIIMGLEIIKYETEYAICLKNNSGTSEVIPKSYNSNEFGNIVDVTAE